MLHYRGTGLQGDQRLDCEGNRCLRDAKANDAGVFVFERGKSGRFAFRGPVELADGPHRRREPDIDGESRWVWVFPLRLLDEVTVTVEEPAVESALLGTAVSAATSTPQGHPLSPVALPAEPDAEKATTHEEVQWMLLEMGASLGLDVWVGGAQ